MTHRYAHLVGSIPAADTDEAMALAVDRLGDRLRYLPDGETGPRRDWIQHVIDGLRTHPALELRRDGDWSSYTDTPRLRVRRGERLTGADLDLGIVAAARAALPTHRVRGAGTTLQVGIPGPIDFALFAFGPGGIARGRRPFAEALTAAMHEVHALTGGDVLFQLELPAEQVLLTRMPPPVRRPAARMLTGQLAALARTAPEGAAFGVHLCLGDLNHRALGRLRDTRPLVHLANAIAARWPASRPLRFVHLPLAEADRPPVDDPAFYRPLRDLRLGAARLVAGYAHERQDLATQRRIRDLVEDAAGHPADVSTSCGLGRRERADALAALDRVRELTEPE